MINKNDSKGVKLAIWFSSILRWTLGLGFWGIGWVYHKEEYSWVLFVFGLLLFATGFIRPRRCIADKCDL
jgi:hypothetical protein